MALVLTDEQKAKLKEAILSGKISPHSQEIKDLILAKYRDDVLGFAHAFLAHHFSDQATGEITNSAPFHHEIINLVSNPDNTRVALAAPRGHAKSTVISLAYVLHSIVYEKRKNITIISASEEMAIRFVRRIKEELESNNLIKFVFGNLTSDKWSETELKTSKGISLHAKGRGAQLRGLIEGANRPDLIVLDDIEDEELVRSETRRFDLETWFNGTVLPTLEPKRGQCVFVGTILHQNALLSRVLDHSIYPDFVTRIYSAIQEDGTALWPEKLTIEQLEKKKAEYIARGQLAQFYMEYQNNPIAQENAEFKQEYFQFFDIKDLPKDHFKEVFVDLGGGSVKASADDTSLVVLATDVHNTIYVVDYISDKMGTDTKRITDAFFELNEKYHPSRFVVEKTQAANFLKQALETEMLNRNVFLNVEYVVPPKGSADRRGNMSDAKYQRIAAMSSRFQFGVIQLQKWQHKLMDQLLTFPRGKHDDLIDALSYGIMFGQKSMLPVPEDAEEELLHSYTPLYGDDIGL